MPREIWMMRRLATNERPQTWHLCVSASNGKYVTGCGLRFGVAGASTKDFVPARACGRCLRIAFNFRP